MNWDFKYLALKFLIDEGHKSGIQVVSLKRFKEELSSKYREKELDKFLSELEKEEVLRLELSESIVLLPAINELFKYYENKHQIFHIVNDFLLQASDAKSEIPVDFNKFPEKLKEQAIDLLIENQLVIFKPSSNNEIVAKITEKGLKVRDDGEISTLLDDNKGKEGNRSVAKFSLKSQFVEFFRNNSLKAALVAVIVTSIGNFVSNRMEEIKEEFSKENLNETDITVVDSSIIFDSINHLIGIKEDNPYQEEDSSEVQNQIEVPELEADLKIADEYKPSKTSGLVNDKNQQLDLNVNEVDDAKIKESFLLPEFKGTFYCAYSGHMLDEERNLTMDVILQSIGEKGRIEGVSDTTSTIFYKYSMYVNPNVTGGFSNGNRSSIFNSGDLIKLFISSKEHILSEFILHFMNSDGVRYSQRALLQSDKDCYIFELFPPERK